MDTNKNEKNNRILTTENTIGTRIAGLLEKKKMTQKQLSRKAGITEAAISHYINETRVPRASVLMKIATALDTTTDYLLEGITPDAMEELGYAKKLIARNAKQMTTKDKTDILKILMEVDDET